MTKKAQAILEKISTLVDTFRTTKSIAKAKRAAEQVAKLQAEGKLTIKVLPPVPPKIKALPVNTKDTVADRVYTGQVPLKSLFK